MARADIATPASRNNVAADAARELAEQANRTIRCLMDGGFKVRVFQWGNDVSVTISHPVLMPGYSVKFDGSEDN